MDYLKKYDNDWDNLLSEVWGTIPDDEIDWKRYFRKEFIIKEGYEVWKEEGLIGISKKDGKLYKIVDGELFCLVEESKDFWLYCQTEYLQNLDNEERRQYYQKKFDSDMLELNLDGHHEITVRNIKEAILLSFNYLHKNYIFSDDAFHLYRGFQNEIHYGLFVKYCTSLANLIMANTGVAYADIIRERVLNLSTPIGESVKEISSMRMGLKYSRIKNDTIGIETSPADIVFLKLTEPLYEHLKDVVSLISLPAPPQVVEVVNISNTPENILSLYILYKSKKCNLTITANLVKKNVMIDYGISKQGNDKGYRDAIRKKLQFYGLIEKKR